MSSPLVVVLGAGRSAGWLLRFLSKKVAEGTLTVTVVDGAPPFGGLPAGLGFKQIQLSEEYPYADLLNEAWCCVSLLPPPMHPPVMRACVDTGTHFFSASYETPFAKSLQTEAEAKKVLIVNEAGFDPGLDHVTALAMLKRVQEWGGEVVSFESDSGGLPDPGNTNDWGYRFFWNPMNVVTAGQAGARFKQNDKVNLISYAEVFKQTRTIGKEEQGELVAYANRDSLPFEALYNLPKAATFIRGTIRYKAFTERWHLLAEAGVANTSIILEAGMAYAEWAALFAWQTDAEGLLKGLIGQAGWEKKPFDKNQTSAEALLALLMQCWNPGKDYLDRALMRHRIVFKKAEILSQFIGQLDYRGNKEYTAMAFLVGLPIAILIEEQLRSPIYGIVTPAIPTVWPIIYGNLTNFGINLAYEVVPLK